MKYIFEYENQKALEDLYFHDCVYEGFSCDYPRREIHFELMRHWEKKRYQLCFRNVVAMEMQGFGFWGGGNAVYHLGIDDNPEYFQRMEDLQTQNPANFRLDQDIRLLSVVMRLNSGDELKLTCQTLEVTEDALRSV